MTLLSRQMLKLIFLTIKVCKIIISFDLRVKAKISNSHMALFDKLTKLEYLNQLIAKETTGSAKELARKLNVTERTVYNLLETIKEFGTEITYSKDRQSYVYVHKIDLCFNPTKRGGVSILSPNKFSSILKVFFRRPA